MTKPGLAAEVVATTPLEPPAKELLRPDHSPKQYLDALTQAGHLADAVRFLAHVLPRREAVWWACQCVKAVPELPKNEKTVAAVAAAEAWAAGPTDDNRRAAQAAAQAAGLDTPAGCCGMAAFFSDGSMAPAHVQAVPPPPHAAPTVAATAVILAAVAVQPEKADEKYKRFLGLGNDVATGTNRWVEARVGQPAPTGQPPTAAPHPQPATKPPPPPPQKKGGWY
jgi:hypothetical protein